MTQGSMHGYNIEIDLIYFNEQHKIEEFHRPIGKFKRFFNHTMIEGEKKKSFVSYKLKDYASTWWEHYYQQELIQVNVFK